MTEDPDAKLARDKALQKIGRNVLVFQKMEGMVKFLIANSRVEGLPDQLQDALDQNVKSIDRKTLGSLIDPLFRATFTNAKDQETESTPVENVWSISFSLEMCAESHEEAEKAFRRIVRERNALIHQMLVNFDPSSTEQCSSLSKSLDAQLDIIKPQYEHLQSIVRLFLDGRKELLAYVKNEMLNSAFQDD